MQASQETASGLIVDIPEGDFPAFGAIAVPDVAPFTLPTEIAPVIGAQVAIDSTFTWEPAGDARSRITFRADFSFSVRIGLSLFHMPGNSISLTQRFLYWGDVLLCCSCQGVHQAVRHAAVLLRVAYRSSSLAVNSLVETHLYQQFLLRLLYPR